MATNKSWSYAELTATTEQYVGLCRRMAAAEEDEDERRIHRLFARGAVGLWDSLTSGAKTAGDLERLDALVDAIDAIGREERPAR